MASVLAVIALAGRARVRADEDDHQVGALDVGLGLRRAASPAAVAVVDVPPASKMTDASGWPP